MYIPLDKRPYSEQFDAGKRAFFAGLPLTFDKPKAWRDGWNQAFSDVMREHEGRVRNG